MKVNKRSKMTCQSYGDAMVKIKRGILGFSIDHGFSLLPLNSVIHENHSGTILFIGKIVEPKSA